MFTCRIGFVVYMNGPRPEPPGFTNKGVETCRSER
jgi:hypothetical protein